MRLRRLRRPCLPRRAACATLLIALCATSLRAQRPDTLGLPVLWEIVEGGAAVADSLGVLSGIAMDATGNMYVSDRGASKVWVFDTRGRSQRGISRKGEGAGEFTSPTGLVVGPGGRLWVRDVTRISRFTVDNATGRLTRFESSINGPTLGDWMSGRASRFTTDGGFVHPEFHVTFSDPAKARTGRFPVMDADGAMSDSLIVPRFPNAPASTAHVQINAGSGGC